MKQPVHKQALTFVGRVTPEIIFNKVLLPEPFLPIIPTVSPLYMSKAILSRARIFLFYYRVSNPALLPVLAGL
jgi:hypothetical protein